MVFHTLAGDFDAPPFHAHCRSIVRPWQPGYVSDVRAKANEELQNRPYADRAIGPSRRKGFEPWPDPSNPPLTGRAKSINASLMEKIDSAQR